MEGCKKYNEEIYQVLDEKEYNQYKCLYTMSDIYFSTDKEGRKTYLEYKRKFDIVFEKKYKELWWNPEDPAYSKYPKEMIECHNNEVKRILEDRLWGSDLDHVDL